MGRRLVVKRAEIYRRRAMYWERHYEARNLVSVMGCDRDHILSVLRRELPVPELDIDGAVVWLAIDIRSKVSELERRFRLPWSHDFHLAWYWSEASWMEFVRAFQALPEVDEDYYYLYDMKADVARLVPMSSKAVQNPVGKSGTSKAFQVQLAEKEKVVVRRW